MTDYKDFEKELFERWQKERSDYPSFIKDGVINEDIYFFMQKTKPIFHGLCLQSETC